MIYRILVGFVAVSLFQSCPARAGASEFDDQPKRKYSRFFNGAFVEPSLRGSWTADGGGDYSGFQLDTGLRHSFPMYIGDTRLGYTYQSLQPRSNRAPGDLEQHNINLHLALHPFYIMMIDDHWLSNTLAAFYLEAGIGASLGVLSANDEVYTKFGPTWSLGAGVDFPLTDPDDGQSLWLNVLYRLQFDNKQFGASSRQVDLATHSTFIGLAWRYNGLLM